MLKFEVVMLDANGKLIRLGDRVTLAAGRPGWEGSGVFSIDTDEFSQEFPKDQWRSLGRGIGVEVDEMGLFHLEESAADLEVIGPDSS